MCLGRNEERGTLHVQKSHWKFVRPGCVNYSNHSYSRSYSDYNIHGIRSFRLINDTKYKDTLQNKNDLMIVARQTAPGSEEPTTMRAQSFTPAKEERVLLPSNF